MSLPVQKPGVAQAASSEPDDTASNACAGGTSAPGSKNFISMEPPEILLIWSTVYFAFGPSNASVEAKFDCIWMRTFLSWADAVWTPNAISEAITNPANFKIVRIIPSPVETTAEVGRVATL